MSSQKNKPRRRPRKAVGPKLKRLLAVVFTLFALLGVNSLYLSTITFLEWRTGEIYQTYFYQVMFLGHLALGLAIVLPVIAFGALHIFNTYDRPNRRAVKAGYALFFTSLALLGTGFVLLRLEGFEIRDPRVRSVAYWVHVIAPFVVAWLFVLHRLSGRRIKWAIGARWLGVSALFTVGMALLHSQDPKQWGGVAPESGEAYFFPSLARTATGEFIPADKLSNDSYCLECHADVHASWSNSVHKFSSFNNPAYLFSVRETRRDSFARDGDVSASRFCAGCHDPVPFFSGAFDDPDFDDVNHPTADDGITCTVCHSITNISSPRGNSDYVIEQPSHYPFAYSENSFLAWLNRQLVKAKPAFHKKTFLKPLHKSPEFCGSCHKVHLPVELNDYKWLRGQNHYDSYHLSGVSGHGVSSFYYPPVAEENCNGCHMPLVASDDFGAAIRDDSTELKVHDHLFPSANTAIAKMVGLGDEVVEAHRKFNEGVMRVDLFGLREGGSIEGELTAPLRPELPELVPGENYLLEAVIRTLKMGHHFTQGTADSNEVWLEISVSSGERLIAKSGGRSPEGDVDPWSHFANAYVIDREGHRLDRRNAEDIFVALYNHQIPPGAGDVVHYRFTLPQDVREAVTIRARLLYRKFDTTYLRYIEGDEFDGNDLPIMTLAEDTVTLPVAGGATVAAVEPPDFPEWQRWNDYGIGLLRKSGTTGTSGELRQAEHAFQEVEKLARPDGPLNLARVFVREGRLEEAVEALRRAAAHDPPAPAWTVAWFSALVDKQNGLLDEAIEELKAIIALDNEETRRRGFDFSQDYRVLSELGQTIYERAKQERGEARRGAREALMGEARELFEQVLEIEPEDLSAHYNLGLILSELGDEEGARYHRERHETYRPDDNARDYAVAVARQADPAANHAAEAVVIYDLQRPGAYELPPESTEGTH